MHVPLVLTDSSDRRHQLDPQGCPLPIDFEFLPGIDPTDELPGEPAYLVIHGSLPAGTLRLIDPCIDPRKGSLIKELPHRESSGYERIPLTGIFDVLPEGTELLLIVDETQVTTPMAIAS